MDKLIIESRSILDGSTHIRVSKKSRELVEEIAKRSGHSQTVTADMMIRFAYERVFIEGEQEEGENYDF